MKNLFFFLLFLCAQPVFAEIPNELPARTLYSSGLSLNVTTINPPVATLNVTGLSGQSGWLIVGADINLDIGTSGIRHVACTLEKSGVTPSSCLSGSPTNPTFSAGSCTNTFVTRLDNSKDEKRGISLIGAFYVGAPDTSITINLHCMSSNTSKIVTIKEVNMSAVHLRSAGDGAQVLAGDATTCQPVGGITATGGALAEFYSGCEINVDVPSGADLIIGYGANVRVDSGAGARTYSAQAAVDGTVVGVPMKVDLDTSPDWDHIVGYARVTGLSAANHQVTIFHGSTPLDASTKSGVIFAFPTKTAPGVSYPAASDTSGVVSGLAGWTSSTLISDAVLTSQPSAAFNGKILALGSAYFNPGGGAGTRGWAMQLQETHESGLTIGGIFQGFSDAADVADYNTVGLMRITGTDSNDPNHTIAIRGSSGNALSPGSSVNSSGGSVVAMALVPAVEPPTSTPTATATATGTVTQTRTITATGTVTNTPTQTRTPTASSTATITQTFTATNTKTMTPTITMTPTVTPPQRDMFSRDADGGNYPRGNATLQEDDGFPFCQKFHIGVDGSYRCTGVPSPFRFFVNALGVRIGSNPAPDTIRGGFTIDSDLDFDLRTVSFDVGAQYLAPLDAAYLDANGACTNTYDCENIQGIYDFDVRPQYLGLPIPSAYPRRILCENVDLDTLTHFCDIEGGMSGLLLTNLQEALRVPCQIAGVTVTMHDPVGQLGSAAYIPSGCSADIGFVVNGVLGNTLCTIDGADNVDTVDCPNTEAISGNAATSGDKVAIWVNSNEVVAGDCAGYTRTFHIELECH